MGPGHVTVAKPEVGADHVTAAEPEVRAVDVPSAKQEVAHPSPCWILAGVILALGLMSLMGTTCIGLGVSRLWQERVTFPPAVGHLTPAETKWRTGHDIAAELEVACPAPFCVQVGTFLARGLMSLMGTT